jgi:hypothetical protein
VSNAADLKMPLFAIEFFHYESNASPIRMTPRCLFATCACGLVAMTQPTRRLQIRNLLHVIASKEGACSPIHWLNRPNHRRSRINVDQHMGKRVKQENKLRFFAPKFGTA